jgi:hypothetical protein
MNADETKEFIAMWDRRTEMTEMKIVIARLTEERDEARREICWYYDSHPSHIAHRRGWDCFKKKETP